MLCMTPLKAGLPVAVRQLFSFIAVAASEIVTVIHPMQNEKRLGAINLKTRLVGPGK